METTIEWTDYTFNPWWGCTKVSPACDSCYAERSSLWRGQAVWGAEAPRRFLSEATWRKPLEWNRRAEAGDPRHRVFCGSMCDILEKRSDLDLLRDGLWELIEATPNLVWQLLTKRPQHYLRMTPWGTTWPSHVWAGTTVENQQMAKVRIPHLLRVPAVVRFLSCEPLLEPLDLRKHLVPDRDGRRVDWVIVGGESGPSPRLMEPSWVQSIRDQCLEAEVPFFFKQWGGRNKKAAGRELDGRTWDEFPRLKTRRVDAA